MVHASKAGQHRARACLEGQDEPSIGPSPDGAERLAWAIDGRRSQRTRSQGTPGARSAPPQGFPTPLDRPDGLPDRRRRLPDRSRLEDVHDRGLESPRRCPPLQRGRASDDAPDRRRPGRPIVAESAHDRLGLLAFRRGRCPGRCGRDRALELRVACRPRDARRPRRRSLLPRLRRHGAARCRPEPYLLGKQPDRRLALDEPPDRPRSRSRALPRHGIGDGLRCRREHVHPLGCTAVTCHASRDRNRCKRGNASGDRGRRPLRHRSALALGHDHPLRASAHAPARPTAGAPPRARPRPLRPRCRGFRVPDLDARARHGPRDTVVRPAAAPGAVGACSPTGSGS